MNFSPPTTEPSSIQSRTRPCSASAPERSSVTSRSRKCEKPLSSRNCWLLPASVLAVTSVWGDEDTGTGTTFESSCTRWERAEGRRSTHGGETGYRLNSGRKTFLKSLCHCTSLRLDEC